MRIINNDWAENQTEASDTEIMLPDNLHCTSHVVVEPDMQYQKDWFNGEKGETLSLDKMFWLENVCAVSVCLTEKQFQFCLIAEDYCVCLTYHSSRPEGRHGLKGGVFEKRKEKKKKAIDATGWCKTQRELGGIYSMSECKHEVELEMSPHVDTCPNYAILEQPLRALTIGKGLKSTDKIDWNEEAGYENSAVSSPNFGPTGTN